MVKVKTIDTSYTVKVNGQIIDNKFPTVWEAKKFINSLVINDDLNTVDIVKQTTTETTVKSYQTKVTKILMSNDLDEGLE